MRELVYYSGKTTIWSRRWHDSGHDTLCQSCFVEIPIGVSVYRFERNPICNLCAFTLCTYCGRTESLHAKGKCLFGSTKYRYAGKPVR